MRVDGACHCGAIAFTAEADPARVSVCHCVDCQVLTGSAWRVSVPAAAAGFRLLRGTPRDYVKTAESGNRRVQAFCADCGTPLYACDAEAPKVYMLRVGALAQRAELPPQRQIWCRSALAWASDITALPPFEKS